MRDPEEIAAARLTDLDHEEFEHVNLGLTRNFDIEIFRDDAGRIRMGAVGGDKSLRLRSDATATGAWQVASALRQLSEHPPEKVEAGIIARLTKLN